MKYPSVSIVIVHWNTPRELKAQISKLEFNDNIEIIIVDNKSDKNLEVKNKNLRIIHNNSNLGFATACNQGAKFAKGEWLLFLNPDTHISTSEIQRLVLAAEDKGYDAISPMQKGDSYFKPLPSWLSLVSEFSPLRRFIPLSIFKKRTLFGGCLLIRSSVLKKLGGWDQRFFLWFEDSDLTKRLYDKGYRVGWLPVQFTHIGGSSFKLLRDTKRKTIFFTSMKLYARKHFSVFGQFVVKLITYINV